MFPETMHVPSVRHAAIGHDSCVPEAHFEPLLMMRGPKTNDDCGDRPAVVPEHLRFLNPVVVADLQRFGNRNDGGYVLPATAVGGVDVVLSFGISDDWSLEKDLSRRFPGILIHAYDHTIGEYHFKWEVLDSMYVWLRHRSNGSEIRSRLSTYFDYRRFFRSSAKHFEERISARAEVAGDTTIEKVFSRIPEGSRVFLKMDIEGGEYDVIPHLLAHCESIDLMAIEFHDTEASRARFESSVRHLLDRYEIVHLHGNNCDAVAADCLPRALEITLLKRSLMPEGAQRRDLLPVQGLDAPNNPRAPDIRIVFATGE